MTDLIAGTEPMRLEASPFLRHPEPRDPMVHVTASTEYVWLVLREGPPGSFPHSQPAGYSAPPDADAWMLMQVDAITGQLVGRSIGQLGHPVGPSWDLVQDLATEE
ncbi:MAG: hypothetical protein ACRDY3_02280 [Acidimicrobiales bacterium]